MPTLERRTEDLLIALLAELATQGVDTLRINDRAFHDHFGKILDKMKDAGQEVKEVASQYYRNIVSGTYDELDHALIAAEQFGFVKFPNPSYSRLTIAITPRMANQLLADWSAEDRHSIEEAARELRNCQR